VGAEIAATVAEEAFDELRAPILRVVTADVPIPFSRSLEAAVEPSEDRIVAAVRSVVEGRRPPG
jgi:pyruvate dehydrogenase E1 component beta subunit